MQVQDENIYVLFVTSVGEESACGRHGCVERGAHRTWDVVTGEVICSTAPGRPGAQSVETVWTLLQSFAKREGLLPPSGDEAETI